MSKSSLGREKKGQSAISPLVLLSGPEGVGETEGGKTASAVFKVEGYPTSLGAWELMTVHPSINFEIVGLYSPKRSWFQSSI